MTNPNPSPIGLGFGFILFGAGMELNPQTLSTREHKGDVTSRKGFAQIQVFGSVN